MADRFAHRYAGPWGDQVGDEDIHLAGLLGDGQTGKWDGLNVIIAKDGLICPRPGLLSMSSWGTLATSTAWAGLSSPSISGNVLYALMSGDAVVYEVDAEGGDTWASSGVSTTGSTDLGWFQHVGNSETLLARIGTTDKIAALSDWSTTLTTNISANDPVMVAEGARVYAKGDAEVAYSECDPTTVWEDGSGNDLEFSPAFEGQILEVDWIASHDQGVFIVSNGGVFLLAGNPETGVLRQVAPFNTVRALEAYGTRAYAVSTDGAILTWNGATFERTAAQFQSDLAAEGFSQASTTRGKNTPIILSESGNAAIILHGFSGEFLLNYNGRWTRHQFHQASWTAGGTSPSSSLMQIDPRFIQGAPLRDSTASGMRHTFWFPALVDESATDHARVCVMAFDNGTAGGTDELFQPASNNDTPQSDTVDVQGAFTVNVQMPTRWANPGQQFRVRRVVACIRRAASTESGDNEITLKITTYDRRGGATPSDSTTYAWTDTQDGQEVDFVTWDLLSTAVNAGDAYSLEVTNLVGVGIRHLEVFGDIEDEAT